MNDLELLEKPEEIEKKRFCKETIDLIEKIIRAAPGATVANEKSELGNGCKYEHTFTDGLYIRKMFLPKDTLFVTRVHKTNHPYFIMQGDVSVFLDGEMVRIQAPFSGITKIGTRRALRTHEDTIWITVHVTEKTDIADICKDLATDTVEEFEAWQKQISGTEIKHIGG